MKQPENETQKVLDQLSILEPTAADSPQPAAIALSRLKQQIESRHKETLLEQLVRHLRVSQTRLAFAAALLIMLIGVSLSFPSVRAAASEFLGLFRVRKFAAISISADQLALLERIGEQGLMPGEFEISMESSALTPVASLSEAGAITGMSVHSPTALGDPDEIFVSAAGTGSLTIDLEGSRAILEAAGVDPMLLSDSLDGQQVDVTIYAGVEQHWRDGTWLLQTESPLVNYPDTLDPTILGQAALQLLGMSQEESIRLAQSIDWTSTLLLPVPQDFATFNEVTVNGVSGLALSSLDGQHGAIMWQYQGVIYVLNGAGDTSALVSIADSIR